MGFMSHKRLEAQIKLIFCIFAAVAVTFYLLTFFRTYGYQLRYFSCIDLLKDGHLYFEDSDCAQPPGVYIVGLVISSINLGWIHHISNVLIIVLHTCCLYLLLRLVKTTDKKVTGTVILLYCLMIVPISVKTTNETDLATMLASFFIMCAANLFFLGRRAQSMIWTSILLTLAVTSKVSALSVFVAIFIVYIYPDLIEIGIHAVNSQLFCMNIEELGRLYRGKITFWGEHDRQHLLPFGTPEQVREGVRRVRRALDDGTGGVIAQCEWGVNDPMENTAAVFDEWNKTTGLEQFTDRCSHWK